MALRASAGVSAGAGFGVALGDFVWSAAVGVLPCVSLEQAVAVRARQTAAVIRGRVRRAGRMGAPLCWGWERAR